MHNLTNQKMKSTNEKVSEYFGLHELVPREYATKYSNEQLIAMISPKVIGAADLFRKLVGKPVTINNWHSGGTRNYSGIRPQLLKLGAPLSRHKVFMNKQGYISKKCDALDLTVEGMSGAQMRKIILDNESKFCDLISRIEDGTSTWLHIDCAPTNTYRKIVVFPFWKPKA